MRFFWVISCIVLAACGSQVKEQNSLIDAQRQVDIFELSLVGSDKVPYSGYINLDEFKANQAASGAYYVGYDALTFLASVMTHAAISKAADSKKMHAFIEKENEEALSSCRDILSSYSMVDFEESISTALKAPGELLTPMTTQLAEAELPRGYIKSIPKFVITKANDSIIIENVFVVSDSDFAPPEAAYIDEFKEKLNDDSKHNYPYVNTVVYLSDPITDPQQNLLEHNGIQFKALTEQLFMETLELFDNDFANSSKKQSEKSKPKPYKTIKYSIGDNFRVERGQVLERTCDRVTFKTLRGWIKSVPQGDCQTSEPTSAEISSASAL